LQEEIGENFRVIKQSKLRQHDDVHEFVFPEAVYFGKSTSGSHLRQRIKRLIHYRTARRVLDRS